MRELSASRGAIHCRRIRLRSDSLTMGKSRTRRGDRGCAASSRRTKERTLRLPGGPNTQDALVLEEATNERPHPDVLRDPGHAGPQAADPANDQVDGHARLRRA